MAKTLADGSIEVEKGDTLSGIYGSNWKEASGYTGDPTKLQIGTKLPAIKTNSNNIITSESLSGDQSKIKLPDQPIVSDTSGSEIKTNVDTSSAPDWLKKYLEGSVAPVSQADLYKTDYENSGIEDKTKIVNDLQAELNSLTADETAMNLGLENQGAGITAGGVEKSQKANSREIAIKALPIQAKLAAAQNNLSLAQSKFDTYYKLKSEDAKTLYDYNKELRDKAYDYATEAEKTKLATQQKEDDKKYTTQQNNLNYAQSLSSAALSAGQANLAAAITKLDPTSETFIDDLAKLEALIKTKDTKTESENKLLDILDVQRYNELYPDAGIIAGDTVAQANQKIAATNTPEAKMRSLIVAAKNNNNDYKTVVKEINNDNDIQDKELALKIAKEIYGIKEEENLTLTPEEKAKQSGSSIGGGLKNFFAVETAEQKAARLKQVEQNNKNLDAFIGGIYNSLFK
jgi:hypothetical protein